MIPLHYLYEDPRNETVYSLTALDNKIIVIIYCIHCDFMLPIRKNFLRFLLVEMLTTIAVGYLIRKYPTFL